MKTIIKNIIFIAYVIGGLLIYDNSRATNVPERITVSPSFSVLRPDANNEIMFDVTFSIPPKYLTNRSRLVIIPQLWIEDSLYQTGTPVSVYAPIYAKKMQRREVLENIKDEHSGHSMLMENINEPFEVPFKGVMQLPEDVEKSLITAVFTTDGCGECTGFDTLTLAMTSSHLSLLADEPFIGSASRFVVKPKISSGKGVARLQFKMNKWDILPEMGNNRTELNAMLNRLAPIVNDTLTTMQSFTITGLASADGSIKFNSTLASKRAHSALYWLADTLNFSQELIDFIKIESRPEGWQPVLDAMKSAGSKNATLLENILIQYADENDDVQERHIRKLPCWNEIKDNYLQKDRNVEYTYSYSIKSFTTDRELLDMYQVRPDSFNEEELLRVAELVPETSRGQVYEELLRRFPDNSTAANNLAIMLMDEGITDRAEQLFRKSTATEAKYNLGLLLAKSKRLDEAWELLSHTRTLSSAVVALELHYNVAAYEILSKLEDESPRACYVRALAAARLNKKEECERWLEKASADMTFKERATCEPEFIKIGLY